MYILRSSYGFTLIESSIVLIIIALIIGGILTGRDLIGAAEIRAQVSQIEKYNTAVRTFQAKYGGIPGDLSQDAVTKFGFTVVPNRPGGLGQGDGNGILNSYLYASGATFALPCCISGETAWFWEDLSSNSGLIEGKFYYSGAFAYPYPINDSTAIKIKDIIPNSKFTNVYVDVYSNVNGSNYFSLLALSGGWIDDNGAIWNAKTMLTVRQAYAIDKKLDDGYPQTGNVTAQYQQWSIALTAPGGINTNYGIVWASGGLVQGATDTSATPATNITCFDNNGTSGTQQYSVTTNNGNGTNCALSFKFQ